MNQDVKHELHLPASDYMSTRLMSVLRQASLRIRVSGIPAFPGCVVGDAPALDEVPDGQHRVALDEVLVVRAVPPPGQHRAGHLSPTYDNEGFSLKIPSTHCDALQQWGRPLKGLTDEHMHQVI